MGIKAKKIENGFMVTCGKKEVFVKDEDEGRKKVYDLYLSDVAPAGAAKEANKLFPVKSAPTL